MFLAAQICAINIYHQCQYAAALAPGCCLHASFHDPRSRQPQIQEWQQHPCELLGCAGRFSAPVSTVSCMTPSHNSPRTSSAAQETTQNLQKCHKLFKLQPHSGEAEQMQVDLSLGGKCSGDRKHVFHQGHAAPSDTPDPVPSPHGIATVPVAIPCEDGACIMVFPWSLMRPILPDSLGSSSSALGSLTSRLRTCPPSLS